MDRKEIVRQYRQIPTSNVCDAMLNLGIPIGAIFSLRPLSMTQPRAVGFARTLKQVQRHQAAQGKNVAKHGVFIDESLQEDDLLVIDVGGRTDICTGGAMLALRAKMRGCAGYVINGALRDVRDIVEMDFPVHLAGVSPVKSAPNLQTVGIDVPVEIDHVQITPGDLIVTDDTGVVVVPADQVEPVLAEAQAVLQKETGITELVAQGKTFAEAAKAFNL